MTQNRLVGCEAVLGVICRVLFLKATGSAGGAEIRSDFFGSTFGPAEQTLIATRSRQTPSLNLAFGPGASGEGRSLEP
jgi:hypothetical protein